MAKRKRSTKARNTKAQRSSKAQKAAAFHDGHKILLVSFIAVLLLGTVTWFSQDFPSVGKAFEAEQLIEKSYKQNRVLLTTCDDCVLNTQLLDRGINYFWVDGKKVGTPFIIFYGEDGTELEVDILTQQGTVENLRGQGVESVGVNGKRYPVSDVSLVR